MLSSYYTVKDYGRHEITIQKSRFIASVNRAESGDAAKQFIEKMKKEHHGANHNCSAYMIGAHDETQKASDDGEPSGTAGVPILEVLKKRQLKDTVIVVTRYFGGIKLGAGGLIRAYGSAASEELDSTGIVRCELVAIINLTFDYTWLGKLENEIRNADYLIRDIRYLGQVDMSVYVPEKNTNHFTEWIRDLTNGQAVINEGEKIYLEKDI